MIYADKDLRAHEDFFDLMLGAELGSGISRRVFILKHGADNLVAKVEKDGFQNVHEWNVWNRVEGTAFAKWFAPAKALSPDGRVLIMERTIPAVDMPDQVPAFFTDLKWENFGVLSDKRFVCHDYGTTLLVELGMTKRMRRAQWRRD